MKRKQAANKRALSLAVCLALALGALLSPFGGGAALGVGEQAQVELLGSPDSLRVLAIEPDGGKRLTAADVAAWTGAGADKISITHCSTAEFIGKNDDLIESYDLVYIGDSGGEDVPRLDEGYAYAGIGSAVALPDGAAGLTDAEYSSADAGSSSKTFSADGKTYYALKEPDEIAARYSGNDLSAKKLDALSEYARAGHPVILADGLTKGGTPGGPASFAAKISGEGRGDSITFTARPEAVTGVLPDATPTYQWYSYYRLFIFDLFNDRISGATSPSYTTTNDWLYYYCRITYTIDGQTYTAQSDSVRFTPGSGATVTITNDTSTAQTTNFQEPHFLGVNSGFGVSSGIGWTWVSPQTNSTIPSGTQYRYTLYKVFTPSGGSAVRSVIHQTTLGYGGNVSLSGIDMRQSLLDSSYYYWTIEMLNSAGSSISGVAAGRRNTVLGSGTGVWISENALSAEPSSFYTEASLSPVITAQADPSIYHVGMNIQHNKVGINSEPSFRWYRDGSPLFGQTGYYLGTDCLLWADGESHRYHCVTSYQNDLGTWTATSNTLIVTRRDNASSLLNYGGGIPANLPEQTAQELTINTDRVDNSSNMFAFLYGVKELKNVMRAGGIDSAALQNALSLSRPTLHLSAYPTPYSRDAGGGSGLSPDAEGLYTLEYALSISGDDDARYACNLYIDSDADGRYVPLEQIKGVSIREQSGAAVVQGELKAGVNYVLTRLMPSDRTGYLPWKLEIVQAGYEDVHSSVTGASYIPPNGNPESVNILQINTSRTAYDESSQKYGYGDGGPYGGLPLDASAEITDPGVRNTRDTILGLLAQVSDDYALNIQTITAAQANAVATAPVENALVEDEEGAHTAYSDIAALLDSYDMLLLGFDDCYNELSPASADAIAAYLESGRPVLCTYGVLSLSNVPQAYLDNKDDSGSKSDDAHYYGYALTRRLRAPLGLDRYGVTSASYGRTVKSNPISESDPMPSVSGPVAAGYAGLTEEGKQTLVNEGYSLAFLPGSGSAETVGTTQGLTNYAFDERLPATSLTQLNRGMLTSYPFDLNTTAFGGSLSALPIAATDQPAYQARLNTDDALVWYCLSGTGYDANDAANAYYIFSKGNATYSGFGRSLQNVGEAEAKLFVNTLISAYRLTSYPPEVKFTDFRGENTVTSFLVPADGEGALLVEDSGDPDRRIYFTVYNYNTGRDRDVRVLVSYGAVDQQQYLPTLMVHDAQTEDEAPDSGVLTSDRLYYLRLDEVLGKLSEKGVTLDGALPPLNITATIRVRGAELHAAASIKLQKYTLFALR